MRVPLGAIENGREHFRRLVDHYAFEDQGGLLYNCVDFDEAKRCFEHLASFVTALEDANTKKSKMIERLNEKVQKLQEQNYHLENAFKEEKQRLSSAEEMIDAYEAHSNYIRNFTIDEAEAVAKNIEMVPATGWNDEEVKWWKLGGLNCSMAIEADIRSLKHKGK